MPKSKPFHKHKIILPALLSCLLGTGAAAQQSFYRADQQISFKWRYGYSEFPFPHNSEVAMEDALRGKFGWYDGALWSQAYKAWDSSDVHGVQLLFRGGSPYAREVKCTSEIVPYEAAGTAVSFLLPIKYTIGSEEDVAFSLRVEGREEETIVCRLRPQAVNSFTGGMMKVNFISLDVSNAKTAKPLVSVSGFLHIRVYAPMVNYGGRTEFILSSVTRHMDVESSMVIGSVYNNMAKADPYRIADSLQLSADYFKNAVQTHESRLQQWREASITLSKKLQQKGSVEVFCQGPMEKRDRGELRVTAYSGNPVKDFQYGEPSNQMNGISAAVTGALGKKFSLFRYQHHYLPWKIDNPQQLDSSEVRYLKQWLEVAGQYADSVILDLQLSPIVKLYKQFSRMGTVALPAAGIPGAEWNTIREGYLTTLRFATKICPSLRIIQMPYELDNIGGGELHADAHYNFFRCLYEAVYAFNAGKPPAKHLRIAGLGVNNPNYRWEFIDGFLKRYSNDTSHQKQLDYLTWHTYLFPNDYPSMIAGAGDSLRQLLKKHGLSANLPVIVDEMGLAEPSTIEDLSDLTGAMQKEAAMASFTTVLQDYYDREKMNCLPISGAGWHFALLTYGKQNILSTYAKGILLRNKLGDLTIPVKTGPIDSKGFGLHAIATRDSGKISILLFCASPSIFYSQAAALDYTDIQVKLQDLPAEFRNRKLKITQWLSSPDDKQMKSILSKDKYQTLPLTRGADRYEKDFSPEEVKLLNNITSQSAIMQGRGHSIDLSVALDAYGMRLIQIEPVNEK